MTTDSVNRSHRIRDLTQGASQATRWGVISEKTMQDFAVLRDELSEVLMRHEVDQGLAAISWMFSHAVVAMAIGRGIDESHKYLAMTLDGIEKVLAEKAPQRVNH